MYMWTLGSSVLCSINAPHAQMRLCNKGREVITSIASVTIMTITTVITITTVSLLSPLYKAM